MLKVSSAVAMSLMLLGPLQPAMAQAKGALRCPAPSEIVEAARSFGTGADNERRAYTFFLERYGRPMAFSQNGDAAEMTYGSGRAAVRISLQRDQGSGLVDVRCRDGR